MGQIVQEMRGSDPTSFLFAAVAAAGSVVSLITLGLTIVWRLRDRDIRMPITLALRQQSPNVGTLTQEEKDEVRVWMDFTAVNDSSTPLYPAEAYLQAEDGRRLPTHHRTMPGWGVDVLHPRSPAHYYYSMARVAEFLSSSGKESAHLKFVVRDGTGKSHEQGLTIRDIEKWAEGRQGREPSLDPRHWWQRLMGT